MQLLEAEQMSDFFEVDFLQVNSERSGDAIAIRYQLGQEWWVHVVDGGYQSTTAGLAAHIRNRFGTNVINHMVVTHPDQDHAEGLATLAETMEVQCLWMLRPWLHSSFLLPYFARYTSAENLSVRLRQCFPYIDALEKVAIRRGILIKEPFQGESIGPFKVLAPSPGRYFQLVISSDKTPQEKSELGILSSFFDIAKPIARFIRAGWGSEKFSTEETSTENEMSVIQYASLVGREIVLTGDAGRGAMNEAAAYAPQAGLFLPGVSDFQVPHHGGRRNVNSAILNQWLGPVLPSLLPEGHELFQAVISASEEDADHPRKAVLRGLLDRGAKILNTEDGNVWLRSQEAPARHDYYSAPNPSYPDEQED
jgi:beta-lactamase superfamily II metal-dependent hydrolase